MGCFCLIDQGEVDWKILIIDAEEAKRNRVVFILIRLKTSTNFPSNNSGQ